MSLRFVRDDNHILSKFRFDFMDGVFVQSRSLWFVSGESPHASNEILHLVDSQVLSLEKNDASVRDQSRQVFYEFIGLRNLEEIADLQRRVRKPSSNLSSFVVCTILRQASEEQ